MTPLLACDKVSKAYGGLMAVKEVTFAVEPGEIFAIVGPNGAGKTTLFDTISGISPVTNGTIQFNGREIQRLRPDRICRFGIARTFQTTVAFDTQTVLTNTLIGSLFGGGDKKRKLPTLRFQPETVKVALDALESCALIDKQEWQTDQLSGFERKRLMLATALATQPKLLLLDEPVGGLNRTEREEMIQLVKRINRSGVTILMIEHVMRAVQALADRMLVLHHGEIIAEGPPTQVLRDKRVVEVYLGRHGIQAV